MSQADAFSDIRTADALDAGAPGQDDTAAIAGDIEQTRTEMGATIEAIQERLAPERLTDQAMDVATDATEQAKAAALEVTNHAIQEVKTAVQGWAELTHVAALEAVDHAAKGAKEAAQEATDHAMDEAKAAVRELTDQAKAAIHDATVGRVERMAGRTNEAAGGLRSSIATTIQQNPIPAALVGLGLGWMLLNRPSSSTASPGEHSSYRSQPGSRTGYSPYASPAGGWPTGETGMQAGGGVGQAAGQAVDQMQETTGQVVGQVQHTAGQVVDQAQETAGQVVDQVQETASQARGRLEQMLHENPMQVGALAAVLGGALGLAAPPTSREQELMGPARDRLVDRVQETAQATLDKVEHVAEEVQDTAAKEAKYQGLAT